MVITAAVITAGVTYWVLSVRSWNKQCAAAREQFLNTNH